MKLNKIKFVLLLLIAAVISSCSSTVPTASNPDSNKKRIKEIEKSIECVNGVNYYFYQGDGRSGRVFAPVYDKNTKQIVTCGLA